MKTAMKQVDDATLHDLRTSFANTFTDDEGWARSIAAINVYVQDLWKVGTTSWVDDGPQNAVSYITRLVIEEFLPRFYRLPAGRDWEVYRQLSDLTKTFFRILPPPVRA